MPRAPVGDDRAARVRQRRMPHVCTAAAGAAGWSRRHAPMLANAVAVGALHREIRCARGRHSAQAVYMATAFRCDGCRLPVRCRVPSWRTSMDGSGRMNPLCRHPRARQREAGIRWCLRGACLDPGAALRAVRDDVKRSAMATAFLLSSPRKRGSSGPGEALTWIPARPCGWSGMANRPGAAQRPGWHQERARGPGWHQKRGGSAGRGPLPGLSAPRDRYGCRCGRR